MKLYTSMMRPPFNLSLQEMTLYSLMQDRLTLTEYKVKNGDYRWFDKNDYMYFVFDRDEAMKFIRMDKSKFPKLKNKLIELGLLREEIVKGYATRYYMIHYNNDAKEKIEAYKEAC